MKTLLFVTTMLFIKVFVFPDLELLTWVFIVMCIDFITGVIKARIKRNARTSSGFRKTLTKFLQYGGSIVVGIVLANIAEKNNIGKAIQLLGLFNNGLLIFIIYIECTSICENIYEVDKRSMFAKYFIKNVLNILTFQIKNNPSTQTKHEEHFSKPD